MKKKIYLLLLAFPLLVGCEVDGEKESKKTVGIAEEIYIVEIEEHKYVIYEGCYKGGIVHAESCPCKERRDK